MKAQSLVRFPGKAVMFGLLFAAACSAGNDDTGTTGPGGRTGGGAGGATGTGGATTGAGGATGTGGATTGGGTTTGTGGATTGTGGATTGTGGATTGTGGATTGTGGATTGTGGASGATTGTGGASGATTGTGGAAGKAGAGGSAGKAGAGGSAGAGGMSTPDAGGPLVPLDCGAEGWAVENAGPPSNRINYVILGDGYTAATVETTLKTHIETAMQRRFGHESGQPYLRYRKFVNICVMKAVSQSDGIGNGPTAFDGGNGGDRLAKVNSTKVNDYIAAKVPKSFEIDWKAVVLNQSLWENTGSVLMLWSGGNKDAAGANLHEAGHGHHQLADEYGTCTGLCGSKNVCGASGTEYSEVNSTGDCMTTAKKWDLWLGTTQKGMSGPEATGLQGTFEGSRYVGPGQYRPSANSMMNSLFGTNVNTSFNSVSREQMVFTIWRACKPVDEAKPPAGPVSNPATLELVVIDPAVIDVDWSVDNAVVAPKGGPKFDVAAAKLTSGMHTVSAKAYDNATDDLVRYRDGVCQASVKGNYCHATGWKNSTQTITWAVTIP